MPQKDSANPEITSLKGAHLYHFGLSSCSQRVRMVLDEKRIEWVSHHVDLNAMENVSNWYQSIHPQGYVPAFVHDGKLVTESIDIIRYIDATFSGGSLSGPSNGCHRQLEEWLTWADDNQWCLKHLTYELVFKKKGHFANARDVNHYIVRNLYHSDYDPVWRAIAATGKPICIHDSGSPYWPSYGDRMETHTAGHIIAHPVEAMVAMMSLIWFGVFERHPSLKIVHVEADAGWLPYWLQRMEQHYDFSGKAEHPDLQRRPTEYFKSNFLVAARGDEMTLPAAVQLVGEDFLTFNTDYPHPDGTWPPGMQDLEDQPISDEAKRKIFWSNAAALFGVD